MPWQRPNIGSRVNREVHARFWERPEVKFLRATRQFRHCSFVGFRSASAISFSLEGEKCQLETLKIDVAARENAGKPTLARGNAVA
jgi:hypothetical protein